VDAGASRGERIVDSKKSQQMTWRDIRELHRAPAGRTILPVQPEWFHLVTPQRLACRDCPGKS
jgi:hypothetical protein